MVLLYWIKSKIKLASKLENFINWGTKNSISGIIAVIYKDYEFIPYCDKIIYMHF